MVTLNDKWTVTRGPVLINGMQAIARMLLVQSELDRSRGLKTAGYVSGYRGSPVGNLDTALWAIRDRLTAAGIVFQPGVNEDLAATAVRGTQQLGFLPNPKVDGVFAAWYGKGPGVDRSTDALKHGNYAGTSPTGGVLCLYGDDHAGKSSTVAHQSEQAMAACLIPSLYPATAAEIVTFGLYGYALSRYSGLWVGLKLVNETAEQTMTADLALDDFEIVIPPEAADGIHIRSGVLSPLAEEQVAVEKRLPLVHKFVRANKLDRTVFRAPRPRLGIVAAGKSYGDVRQGLAFPIIEHLLECSFSLGFAHRNPRDSRAARIAHHLLTHLRLPRRHDFLAPIGKPWRLESQRLLSRCLLSRLSGSSDAQFKALAGVIMRAMPRRIRRAAALLNRSPFSFGTAANLLKLQECVRPFFPNAP
ncbi:hypothetical protein [Bradyrhizobium sp. 174]|uniref:hypothetical protein n=1 Tax=Bradyrhizobium sp. 174 TaxID=2782645 RepID=UPI001FF8FCE7|nr:hypothetical protein [Bradyrhizobium sp. 174]MCK1572821.1 hypothetical protein [Bradyrhizobium sp. 174]